MAPFAADCRLPPWPAHGDSARSPVHGSPNGVRHETADDDEPRGRAGAEHVGWRRGRRSHIAGFHQIFVYNPGVEAADINVPPSGTFINDTGNLYFQGILPAGGPPATPATTNPSNAQNRVEPVLFTTPGTYLVICNVRGHFLGGMYAYVVVEDHPNQGQGNDSHE
jgi:hypothetical protein